MTTTERVNITDAGILMLAAGQLRADAEDLKRSHQARGAWFGEDADDRRADHDRLVWLADRLAYIAKQPGLG